MPFATSLVALTMPPSFCLILVLGDARVAWSHFLAADLLVTSRSSFSGLAALYRKHTAPCPTLSIALVVASEKVSSEFMIPVWSPSDTVSVADGDLEYVPPLHAGVTKHSPVHETLLDPTMANRTVTACLTAAIALSSVISRQVEPTTRRTWAEPQPNVSEDTDGWKAPGTTRTARSLDCPSQCLGDSGALWNGSTGTAEAAKSGKGTLKGAKGRKKVRHCPSPSLRW